MIAIVVGTNRNDSKSRELADYYRGEIEAKGEVCRVVDLINLPADFTVSALYDNNGKNEEFNKLRQVPEQADKVLFIIPEYNGSYPGVLKAFIDGFGYPNPLKNKKAALVGIASGNLGASLAMSHFTDMLNYLGCHVYAVKPRIFPISKQLQEGEIADDLMQQVIHEQVEGFINF